MPIVEVPPVRYIQATRTISAEDRRALGPDGRIGWEHTAIAGFRADVERMAEGCPASIAHEWTAGAVGYAFLLSAAVRCHGPPHRPVLPAGLRPSPIRIGKAHPVPRTPRP